jgi:hypothetical protein
LKVSGKEFGSFGLRFLIGFDSTLRNGALGCSAGKEQTIQEPRRTPHRGQQAR